MKLISVIWPASSGTGGMYMKYSGHPLYEILGIIIIKNNYLS